MTFIILIVYLIVLLCDIVFIFFIFFFVFNMFVFGLVTVFERKILSFIGCREGPCVGLKGVSVFLFDFIKFFFKSESKTVNVFLAFFCFFVFSSFFFFLPFSFSGLFLSNSSVIIWILESFILIFEILYFSFLRNKFGVLSCFRLKILSLAVDGVCVFMCLPIFSVFSYFDIRCWSEAFSLFSFFEFILFFPLGCIYLILISITASRPPFDYFESESEVLGGNVVDLGGVFFIVWSLIEYGEVFFKCVFFVSFFFTFLGDTVLFPFVIMFFVFFVLFLRGILPRLSFYESMHLLYYRLVVLSIIVSFFTMAVSFFIYAF